MDLLHFASYAVAIVALFVWNQWQRHSRLLRVFGAVVILVGVALLFPWAVQHIRAS